MDEDRSTGQQEASAEEALPAGIPMKKTSPLVWVGLGVGAVVVGGLAVFAGGGSPGAAERARPEKPTSTEQALSAKEMREHLLTTQKAFAAGEEEAARSASEAAAPPAELDAGTEAAEPEAVAARPAPGQQTSSPKSSGTSKKTSGSKQPKQKLESLDSLGADITSALK